MNYSAKVNLEVFFCLNVNLIENEGNWRNSANLLCLNKQIGTIGLNVKIKKNFKF